MDRLAANLSSPFSTGSHHECYNSLVNVQNLNWEYGQIIKQKFNFRNKIPHHLYSSVDKNHIIENLCFRVGKIRIKPKLKEKEPKVKNRLNNNENLEEKLFIEEIKILSDEEVNGMTDNQILELATQTREGAMGLQDYILKCPPNVLKRLSKLVALNLAALMNHALGNYSVSKVLQRDSNFGQAVLADFKNQFAVLVQAESTSRVLQTLIEVNLEFRAFARSEFQNNLLVYTNSFSSSVLVITVITVSHLRNESVFDIKPFKNMKGLLYSKHGKKVLIAFLQVTSPCVAAQFYSKLMVNSIPNSLFRSKQGCLVYLAFIDKGIPKATLSLLRFIEVLDFEAFEKTSLEFLIEQLQDGIHFQQLKDKILKLLVSFPKTKMKVIQASSLAYRNYSTCVTVLKQPGRVTRS